MTCSKCGSSKNSCVGVKLTISELQSLIQELIKDMLPSPAPIPDINQCCGTIDFESSQTVTVHDCGDYYRNVHFEVRISDDDNNILELHDDGIFVKISPYDETVRIKANTIDGADNLSYIISGGGEDDYARGATLKVHGNEVSGSIELLLGDVNNASVDLGYGGAPSSHVRAYANSILQWQTTNGCAFEFKNAANESVGVNTVVLTNSPAINGSAPITWLKVITEAGAIGVIPIWELP